MDEFVLHGALMLLPVGNITSWPDPRSSTSFNSIRPIDVILSAPDRLWASRHVNGFKWPIPSLTDRGAIAEELLLAVFQPLSDSIPAM